MPSEYGHGVVQIRRSPKWLKEMDARVRQLGLEKDIRCTKNIFKSRCLRFCFLLAAVRTGCATVLVRCFAFSTVILCNTLEACFAAFKYNFFSSPWIWAQFSRDQMHKHALCIICSSSRLVQFLTTDSQLQLIHVCDDWEYSMGSDRTYFYQLMSHCSSLYVQQKNRNI